MPANRPQPVEVLDLLSRGLVCGGEVVSRAVFHGPGGEVLADVIVPRPVTTPPAGGRDWADTACGQVVLETLAEYGRPATVRQLAALTGYAYCGGFREKVMGLLGQGRLTQPAKGFFALPNRNGG